MNKPYLYLLSFATGFAVMAGELGVSRLLAPFFGTSTPVWAFVIGTVMASLSLGYLLGGFLAGKGKAERYLVLLPIIGGFALLVMPWLLGALLRGSLALFLQGSMGHLLTLALLAAPLFFLPFLFLGAIHPLLLSCVVDKHKGEVGKAGGWLYAFSTWGGLLGTFVAGLLLVPWLGSRTTLLLCGIALFVLAIFGLHGWKRRAKTASLLAAISLLSVFVGQYALKGESKNAQIIYQKESPYHLLKVLDDGHARRLVFDEGFATQSLQLADGSLPLFDVWGYYALAPALTQKGIPNEVLILGLGAGTSATLYDELYPTSQITGVEIDAAVIDVGRRFFSLPDKTRAVAEDARTFVRRDTGLYDVILVDAFHFPYVPFQLTTREFFHEVDRRLRPGGVLLLNVGRNGADKEVVHAVAHTLKQVFPQVLGVDVANHSNTILVATRHAPQKMAGLAALQLPLRAHRALERLAMPQPWPVPPGAMVLTDEVAPVEWLTDKIFLQHVLRAFQKSNA
ncbi:MAG: fused MFS/spermidine synthase [Cystobacterineae bacterium]|nr:fused MFS/spermidine synthase [Cystobacterineae bacterium]